MKESCTYLNIAVGLKQVHISVHMFLYENCLKMDALNARKLKIISKEDTQCDKLHIPAVFLKTTPEFNQSPMLFVWSSPLVFH